MEENKKIDILEKIFLVISIVDTSVLSLIMIFLITLLTICSFLGNIMFCMEGIVLIYQAIKSLISFHIFVSLGFVGVGILYILIQIFLLLISKMLISVYPLIINNFKRFVGLEETKQEIKEVKMRKNKNIKLLLLVIAIVLIVISLIAGGFIEVIQFIQTQFNFENIGELFLKVIGK